ncbi:hypothetical protein [Actinomadura decatromicini]|uniref:Uncharacterized protein n=1 Tax=Actinomadura decatromicini TaxID=2604572 RepID=A0A5D3FIF6_9ACTN|nr:hypothetical protein [Actinomadura decatromicini]TYK47794.1 hypothetical protein FXF68_19015 [Actinomadura decatromicini]
MDPDESRRGGGPRRTPPVSRAGRGRPAARRTSAGGPRRSAAGRRPAPRAGRPVPPPRPPYEDEPQHHEPQYAEPHYNEQHYNEQQYNEPHYGEQHYGEPPHGDAMAPPPGPGRKPKGRARRGAKPAAARRPSAKGGKGGFGPKLYFGAAAALAVLVLLGLAAVTVLDGGGADTRDTAAAKIGKPAGNGLSPDSYSSSPSSGAYAGIVSRSADPKPLTIEEAFPASAAALSVPDGDVEVKLRAKRLDADCAAAAWGATVVETLGKGGCTQAARGIYAGPKGGYGLAVAVFNLAGSADADRFVATLEHTIGAGFVRPLEAPAPLDGFGHGFGMARGLAMGHFAVVTWAQRLDGTGDEKDATLLSLLIEGGKAPAVLGRAARTAQ